jgi:hypothetical protein
MEQGVYDYLRKMGYTANYLENISKAAEIDYWKWSEVIWHGSHGGVAGAGQDTYNFIICGDEKNISCYDVPSLHDMKFAYISACKSAAVCYYRLWRDGLELEGCEAFLGFAEDIDDEDACDFACYFFEHAYDGYNLVTCAQYAATQLGDAAISDDYRFDGNHSLTLGYAHPDAGGDYQSQSTTVNISPDCNIWYLDEPLLGSDLDWFVLVGDYSEIDSITVYVYPKRNYFDPGLSLVDDLGYTISVSNKDPGKYESLSYTPQSQSYVYVHVWRSGIEGGTYDLQILTSS